MCAHWQCLRSFVAIGAIFVEHWQERTAQGEVQKGKLFEIFWKCLNTLAEKWGQIAAH